MAKNKHPNSDGSETRKQHGKQANRGTQDEIAIIGMIIEENPILKQRILDKIRQVRASASLGTNPAGNVAPKDKKGKTE